MKSFFARLYNGEIHPGKNVVPRSKKYRQALEQSKASMLALSKTLSRRQGELLDQAMWERFLVEQLESTAMYGAGVRFGIELMRELPWAARVRPVIRRGQAEQDTEQTGVQAARKVSCAAGKVCDRHRMHPHH